MNTITELIKSLKKASTICKANVSSADNIDLYSMAEQLDEYIDELNEIENFEVYSDEE